MTFDVPPPPPAIVYAYDCGTATNDFTYTYGATNCACSPPDESVQKLRRREWLAFTRPGWSEPLGLVGRRRERPSARITAFRRRERAASRPPFRSMKIVRRRAAKS